MDDNKSLLDQVFDIGDKLYREMCAAKPSDHYARPSDSS